MTLLREARYALRALTRTPSFTATVLVTLGIGIGMSVAMFTVYHTVLSRALPVRDQDRVVVLWTHRGDPALEVSGDFKQLDEQLRPVSTTLTDVAGVAHWGAIPTPFLNGEDAVVLNRALVSGNYFDVLGAIPAAGRMLRREDPVTGNARSMVISYGAWQRRFGRDSSIVGKTLRDAYSPVVYTIVGVAPPGLDYPAGVEAWTTPWSPNLGAIAVGRLAPGASAEAARAEFGSIEKRVLPAEFNLAGATVSGFSDAVRGNVRAVIAVLSAAVALLLLIACVNVGNLLLLRAASREREIAIRRALGATVANIARQLTVESALLGVAGGALGLVCAQVLLKLLIQFAPANLPRLDVLHMQGVPLGAAAGVTFIAVMVFGVVPSLSAARSQRSSSMQLSSRGGTATRSRRRLRNSLVASQVALALVLLAGAGLLSRSLSRLNHVELGYMPEHLSVVQVSWQSPVPEKLVATGDALLQKFRSIPGVKFATPMLIPPFLGANVFHGPVAIDGQVDADPNNAWSVPLEIGDADYFRTFGISIVRGRGFLDSDREGAPNIAVVSEAVARRLWPNEDPIGKRINYWATDSTTWRTVVGVAEDIRFRNLRDATPTIYLPWRQTQAWQLCIAVRTDGPVSSIANAIRRGTREVDGGLTVWGLEAMDDYLAGPLSQPRLGAFLLSGFGIVALLLAATGLCGVMSQSVRDRTRELGVRMALGATTRRVRYDVLSRAIMVTVAGAIVGLAAAIACSRYLSSLLFEMSPTDPSTLAGATAVLLGVTLVAAYLPARRATKIDPVRALRGE